MRAMVLLLVIASTCGEHRAERLQFPAPSAPEVSVVVPFHEDVETTFNCLHALCNTSTGTSYEVILVDDASTGISVRPFLASLSGVRIITLRQPVGVIRAYNAGARASSAKYVAFLRHNTVPAAGWLAGLLETFRAVPTAAVVGSKLVYSDSALKEAGGVVFRDASLAPYGHLDDSEEVLYNYMRDVDYCSSVALMVLREVFVSVGMFDMLFCPSFYEDVDLAFAVRRFGYRVLYQPTSVAYHFDRLEDRVVDGELPAGSVREHEASQRLMETNRVKFLRKWRDVLEEEAFPPHSVSLEVAKDHLNDECGLHVLVLDYATPRPDQDSGSLRMYHLLQSIRSFGCHVTFTPRMYNFHSYVPMLLALGVEFMPVSYYQHLVDRGSKYDMIISSRRKDFNLILPRIQRDYPDAFLIYDTVDLHFLREEREAKLLHRKPNATAKALELRLMRDADVTLVVSEFELAELRRIQPHLRYDVLSNIHTEVPSRVPFAERELMGVFVANFYHPPNVDGLTWYVENIHDLVLAEVPSYRLVVIGSPIFDYYDTRNLLATLQSKENIDIMGHVEDIAPWFDRIRLSIVPLRYGAGVKGKVSQSLAFGVPVATTTVGAEGMALKDGRHALISPVEGETAFRDFADNVVTLLRDGDVWRTLSRGGRQVVDGHFSLEAATKTVRRLISLARTHKDKMALAHTDHTMVHPHYASGSMPVTYQLDWVRSLILVGPLVAVGMLVACVRRRSARTVSTLPESTTDNAKRNV